MKNVLTKRSIFTLKGNNDLVIDDAEDGELVQGSDKLLHTSIPAPVLMTIPLGTNGKKSKNKDKKDTPVQKPSSARKPSISQMQTETKSENTFTIENVEDNTNENVTPAANGHVSAEKLAKLKYGLAQQRSGPCGLLAAVQAYTLVEMMCAHDGEQLAKDACLMLVDCVELNEHKCRTVHRNPKFSTFRLNVSRKNRLVFLAKALHELCGSVAKIEGIDSA